MNWNTKMTLSQIVDRQIDKQTDRKTDRQTDRQIGRETDTETYILTDRQIQDQVIGLYPETIFISNTNK